MAVREARQGVTVSHARSWELGELYTAVAGMLNLLVLIDAVYRAAAPVTESSDRRPAGPPERTVASRKSAAEAA